MSTAAVVPHQNKFKSFLDHLGSMFLLGNKKALQIETQLAPAEQSLAGLAMLVPGAAPYVATVQGIIGEVVKVQQIADAVGAGTGTGSQKLAAALPNVENVIMSDPLLAGRKIANLDLYNKAFTAITGSFADLLNSLEAPVAPTQAVPVPSPAPVSQAA
jgi:hypothetical protein